MVASIGKFGRSAILFIGEVIAIAGDDAATADAGAVLFFPLTMTTTASAAIPADSSGAR